MSEITRIGVWEARQHRESSEALLVMAYKEDEKFQSAHLEGSISFSEFQKLAALLPRDQEVILYCA